MCGKFGLSILETSRQVHQAAVRFASHFCHHSTKPDAEWEWCHVHTEDLRKSMQWPKTLSLTSKTQPKKMPLLVHAHMLVLVFYFFFSIWKYFHLYLNFFKFKRQHNTHMFSLPGIFTRRITSREEDRVNCMSSSASLLTSVEVELISVLTAGAIVPGWLTNVAKLGRSGHSSRLPMGMQIASTGAKWRCFGSLPLPELLSTMTRWTQA